MKRFPKITRMMIDITFACNMHGSKKQHRIKHVKTHVIKQCNSFGPKQLPPVELYIDGFGASFILGYMLNCSKTSAGEMHRGIGRGAKWANSGWGLRAGLWKPAVDAWLKQFQNMPVHNVTSTRPPGNRLYDMHSLPTIKIAYLWVLIYR